MCKEKKCGNIEVLLAQQAGEGAVLALTKGVQMKDYELSVLFHPDLEMNLEPAIAKVKDLVEKNGGKITKEENEGKKHMAYPIRNLEYANYYYFEVQLPSDAPAKIEATLNITDEVIRYLLVKVDERKLKFQAKEAARKPHEETEEEEK